MEHIPFNKGFVMLIMLLSVSFSHVALQHLAGTSLVEKLVKSLISEDNTSNVIVDLLGFDAWPACFAMKELATGP